MPTKILAIDDSKTMRLAIKITFAAEDADVTAISKGSEAVARAKQLTPDVILVDAKLADDEPSGYDVVRALKSDPATANVPVLMLVSNQDGIDRDAVAAAGAQAAITKPFDTQELIDEVATLAGSVAQEASARPAAAAASASASARPAAPPTASAAQPRAGAKPAAAPSRPSAPTSPPASAGSRAPASPASVPATASPAAGTPAANNGAGKHGDIPIAVPIPFTSASAPTPGMLKRLQEAAGHTGASNGGGGEIDPQVAAALVALSREVIEQVVWEVVPDLAESIIRQQRAAAP